MTFKNIVMRIRTKTKKNVLKKQVFLSSPPGAFIWINMVYMCKMAWVIYDDGP